MQSIHFSKILNTALRLILAALFLFSGLAKGINPFGLSIQITEYLSAMGLDFLSPLATLLAIALPAGEALLGFMLVFGLLPSVTAWITGLVMAGFTGLTLWIYIDNPVSDCGCFGDLLKISNAATFYKNMAFLTVAILYIYSMKFTTRHLAPIPIRAIKWVVAVIISIGVPLWSTTTLPLIDGTAYKIGVNLVELGDAETPVVTDDAGDITLIYRNKKSGATHNFTVTDTTWYDTLAWECVETISKPVAVQPQSTAKFMMLDATGQDLSASLMTSQPLLLLISPQLIDITPERVAKITQANPTLRVIVLTAAPLEALINYGLEAYGADYSTLRAMIQHSKGGAMLLRGGVIANKWAMPNLPEKIEN